MPFHHFFFGLQQTHTETFIQEITHIYFFELAWWVLLVRVFLGCVCVGGGGGGGGGGVTGVVLVRVCEPVFQNLPHSYTWPLEKRTHSYTWSYTSKMLTYSYTALWFLYPLFAGCYTNIIVNPCNTKRISSLEKSLSEKYMHIPGCQKNGAFHIGIQKKSGHSYTFCWKRGPIIYLAALKKGAIRHAHPYYAIYRKLPHPLPPPPPVLTHL